MDNGMRLNICNQSEDWSDRYLNPNDIVIMHGYKIEVFAEGLNYPSSILFTEDGDLLIASGYIAGNPTVSRLNNGFFEVIADNFNLPLSGINYRNGNLYVSHRGMITVIKRDGSRENIITGLPSNGDYSNSRIDFGSDGKIYFGQGTTTNSGVVGLDNLWVTDHPYLCDSPASYIMLKGQNFETKNFHDETVNTGAYSPYGIPNLPYEIRKGILRASGSILRAKIDGTGLELVASGLRSPSYVKFDDNNRLFVTNNGYDIRGSRPIANAPDEFHIITEATWYGFPDYTGGEPVTSERFKPDGGVQPEFLLHGHISKPPTPFAIFPPDSTILGFDFNLNNSFGKYGDIFVAEFGSIRLTNIDYLMSQYPGVGHRISKIEMSTRNVSTFAINKSGFPSAITREGGFGRPADVAFGPDGAMYIVDTGIGTRENLNDILPNTGVIWRVTKK
jgi:glucose/arabinose dehydrogenase